MSLSRDELARVAAQISAGAGEHAGATCRLSELVGGFDAGPALCTISTDDRQAT